MRRGRPNNTHTHTVRSFCGLPVLVVAVARLPGTTLSCPLGQSGPIELPVAVMTLSHSLSTDHSPSRRLQPPTLRSRVSVRFEAKI